MSASESGFASVPPQVQIGYHQETLNVDVRAIGAGRVSISLIKPGAGRALMTKHAADEDTDILVAVTQIANELRPQLERQHRALMRASGYSPQG